MNITFGAYVVSSNHGHAGRVTDIKFLNAEDLEWVKGLEITPTAEQLKGAWVDILCNGGGAVMVPADTLTEVVGMDFENPYAEYHFAEDFKTIHSEQDLIDLIMKRA